MSRTPRAAATPEETRARIIAVAEESFRRVGYAKTTVADIAQALEMSPANVYRFFPSKAAINDAILMRMLSEIEELAWKQARRSGPALDRIEMIGLETHRFCRNNCLHEQRLHDMVAAGFEENWPSIKRFVERFEAILEGVVREGLAAGEIVALEPAEITRAIKTMLAPFMHPVIIAQCADDDLEGDLRRVMRMLRRAVAVPPPAGEGPAPSRT